MPVRPPPGPISEVTDLWIALFGEPPPVQAPSPVMIEALVGGLPIAPLGAAAPSDDDGR